MVEVSAAFAARLAVLAARLIAFVGFGNFSASVAGDSSFGSCWALRAASRSSRATAKRTSSQAGHWSPASHARADFSLIWICSPKRRTRRGTRQDTLLNDRQHRLPQQAVHHLQRSLLG